MSTSTLATPANAFKQRLLDPACQIGMWVSLASAYSIEICADAGFDWLLIDGEHAPNDLRSILAQLQAMAGSTSHAVVRIPTGDNTLVKQVLDIGAQTLLVPMVDTPEQARALVQACRYPPAGVRGMAGARASRWGRYANYVHEASAQTCLLVQAETPLALRNLDAIAATEGVDGVFIGPADLSAAMGHAGDPGHADVQFAIEDAIARIKRANKAAGILTADTALAHRYIDLGVRFMAVGLDTSILVRGTQHLVSIFKNDAEPSASRVPGTYG